MNNNVFAYMHGDPLSQTTIYHSSNGGYSFQEFIFPRQKELNGTLGGIFHLHSVSQIGMLIIESGKILEQDVWLDGATLTFESTGILNILTPIPDKQFQAFDFRKCFLNIQTVLMHPKFSIQKCNVELLQGPLDSQLYTIDMNSNLKLSAFMVARPGKSPIPLVMVSNPHSLGFQAFMYEYENTLDGNFKYKLDVNIKQQHHWGRSDPNFTSSIKRSTISSLTVDIANKPITCVDLKPLSTLISVGCDTKKKIVVQNKITACSKGFLDAMELQNNYEYVIEKWQEDELQQVVEAEYVMQEVNGVFTYSYSLTASSAGCVSQPQNWTTIGAKDARTANPWNRETYVSCHSLDENNPLRWPDVPYEILGGATDNKLVFKQRNGIYIFFVSIVDPYFSYCHLETTFSIYVYGAYPVPMFSPGVTIMGLISSSLLAVWLAYLIPKKLQTEKGRRVHGFWLSVRQWLRARKIQAATQGPTEDSQPQGPQTAQSLGSK